MNEQCVKTDQLTSDSERGIVVHHPTSISQPAEVRPSILTAHLKYHQTTILQKSLGGGHSKDRSEYMYNYTVKHNKQHAAHVLSGKGKDETIS